MASRILHLAVAEKIMEQINIKDKNRLRLGCILPDACNSRADSHLKIFVCGNSKKTYDLDKFITLFKNEMNKDELYIGYYLHLIQDLIFRELLYGKYKWNPTIIGNVQRLHNDYHLTNLYAIKKYGVSNDVHMVNDLKKEKLFSLYPFEVESFLRDMGNDFYDNCDESIYFFTEAMVDEFVEKAADTCIKELNALAEGRHYIEAYEHAWLYKPFSLLRTTQNTRDLGGYRTKEGTLTKEGSILRSDIKSWATATFDIGGKLAVLETQLILVQYTNTTNFDTTVYFYGDGRLLASYNLLPNTEPIDIKLSVIGINNLEIKASDNIAVAGGTAWALKDAILLDTEKSVTGVKEFINFTDKLPKLPEDSVFRLKLSKNKY